jgi:hypothetical protein
MVAVGTQPPRKSGLEAPLAKIARAREHRDEIQRLIIHWQNNQPVRVGTRRDSATRRLQYVIDAISPLPASLPLVVGEVMHTLRSALDHTCAPQLPYRRSICPWGSREWDCGIIERCLGFWKSFSR